VGNNGPATGCCMAFLYYLFHQLQFTSIPQIIAAASGVVSSNNMIGGRWRCPEPAS